MSAVGSAVTSPGYGTNVILASNASATGKAVNWPGGPGTFTAVATWGGGTVKLQLLGPDGSSWIDAGTDTTLTANGGGNFELPPGQSIRVSIATATGVYASASPTR
jgi:hypothetical protein